mgnify:CR=1 FL=1
MNSVSIIIATTCQASRSKSLLRAIGSVLGQENVRSEVIVVVNGEGYDHELFDCLNKNNQLKVVYRREANVSLARYEGVGHVTSEYFGFLDDDDEYLHHSLSRRVNEMEGDADIDVIVTNGYVHKGTDKLLVGDILQNKIEQNLVLSFFDVNWFSSSSSLFRRRTVSQRVFEFDFKYFEWTYLFCQLIIEKKNIKYCDAVTYRIHVNNSCSASKSEAYSLAQPEFLLELYQLPLKKEIKVKIKKKYQTSLNVISAYYLDNNKRKEAVRFHVRCLRNGGWGYITYTRKLLFNGKRQFKNAP